VRTGITSLGTLSVTFVLLGGLLAGCAPQPSPASSGAAATSRPSTHTSAPPAAGSSAAPSTTPAPPAPAVPTQTAAPATGTLAGASDAVQACEVVSRGLANGSIGVPADPAVLAPATAAADSAVKADASWSALSSALAAFVRSATSSKPDPQAVNRDLGVFDSQCTPLGAPMPKS